MTRYAIGRYDLNTPGNSVKERFHGDLMYKEVVFVYAATLTKGALGGQVHTWAATPVPLSASVQVRAQHGQQNDPADEPDRIAHIYTRKRNGIAWHDKVIWNGITMKVEYVEEKLENGSGEFVYLYARALILSEKDFVEGPSAKNTLSNG